MEKDILIELKVLNRQLNVIRRFGRDLSDYYELAKKEIESENRL